jgi:hypothetical protein
MASEIQQVLRRTARKILSGEDYEQSFAFYRRWFNIGHTFCKVPSDQIFIDIWNNCALDTIELGSRELIHPKARLLLRFAHDAESDKIIGPHCSGLCERFWAEILRYFFENNLIAVSDAEANRSGNALQDFYADANHVALWASHGYVEETVIRDHILQSLISHPKLYDHQADGLYILFKLAGTTFSAYADPSVVDRCFELLRSHKHNDQGKGQLTQASELSVKRTQSGLTQTSRR